MNGTQHGPDTAAAHRRRHEQSHAEAELSGNPAARQHASEPVPVPEQAVTAAEAHVLHRITLWLVAANRDSRDFKLDDAALSARRTLIGDALEAAAPAILEAERQRLAADEHTRLSQEIETAQEQADAVREAVQAERDRIRQLAVEHGAHVDCDDSWGSTPFADLLGGGS